MSFVVELPLDQYHRDAFAAFTPDAGFHIGTARATAWLSRLAYESDPGKIDTMLAAWGLSREASFASPARGLLPMANTRGLVATGGGATLVAFAGTDALRLANWITDFNARLSPAGLHRGFEAAVDTVWPQLLDIIGHSGDRPLFFAGHSLGAALAVLAAERAAAEEILPVASMHSACRGSAAPNLPPAIRSRIRPIGWCTVRTSCRRSRRQS